MRLVSFQPIVGLQPPQARVWGFTDHVGPGQAMPGWETDVRPLERVHERHEQCRVGFCAPTRASAATPIASGPRDMFVHAAHEQV